MKNLIKQILREEIDYGEYLFADKTTDLKYWNNFIKKLYSIDEPNTDDEKYLIDQLKTFIKEPKDIDSGFKSKLTDLIPLKTKFPNILDTSTVETLPVLPLFSFDVDYVYRGTSLSLEGLVSIDDWRLIDNKYLVSFNSNIVITPKSGRGVYSFTANGHYAEKYGFGHSGYEGSDMRKTDDNDNIRSIIGIDKTNPNLLFTDNLMNTISGQLVGAFESEVLYVGDTIKPEVIVVNFSDLKPYISKPPGRLMRRVIDFLNKIKSQIK